MVDYDAFKGPDFKAYLASLDKADPATLDDKERLAFWINVYNAYTIELINKHNERDSIRNINKALGFIKGYGPWKEQLVKAGGKVYHLDNVEHDIIRKQWNEPRIHFALVCAAMGCPPLRSEAYTGARLEDQLQDQAVEFLVRTPDQNRVDVKTGTVYGSPIYVKYYPEDFGGQGHWTPPPSAWEVSGEVLSAGCRRSSCCCRAGSSSSKPTTTGPSTASQGEEVGVRS